MAVIDLQDNPAARPGVVTLPESAFDDLAAGGGSADVVKRLWATEHSRRLVMLRALREAAEETAPDPLTPIVGAWHALERAEQHDAGAVVEVLMHPHVGTSIAGPPLDQ